MNTPSLLAMLAQIKADSTKFLEFGDPQHPLSYKSGIRIRHMNTMGGPQFRLCQLDALGSEASGGIYERTEEEALVQATKMVLHYTRPTPFKSLRRADLSALSWFITEEPTRQGYLHEHPPLPGEVTITLEAPQ